MQSYPPIHRRSSFTDRPIKILLPSSSYHTKQVCTVVALRRFCWFSSEKSVTLMVSILNISKFQSQSCRWRFHKCLALIGCCAFSSVQLQIQLSFSLDTVPVRQALRPLLLFSQGLCVMLQHDQAVCRPLLGTFQAVEFCHNNASVTFVPHCCQTHRGFASYCEKLGHLQELCSESFEHLIHIKFFLMNENFLLFLKCINLLDQLNYRVKKLMLFFFQFLLYILINSTAGEITVIVRTWDYTVMCLIREVDRGSLSLRFTDSHGQFNH